MFAYTNATSDVLSVSSSALDPADVQQLLLDRTGVDPGVLTRIDDAWAGVVSMYQSRPFGTPTYYDQLTSGDGSQAGDYTQASFLLPLKNIRIQEMRDNTDALIAQGAVYNDVVYMSTHDGRFDVLGIFTVGVVAASPGFFPTKVSSTDGDTETEFADAAEFIPFFGMMMGTYKHWKDTSQVLRQEILDATTEAEVNAVTDTRTWPWVP